MHEHLNVKSSMLLLAATIQIRLVALLFILHDSNKHVLDKCKSHCFLVTFACPRLRFAHQLYQADHIHAAPPNSHTYISDQSEHIRNTAHAHPTLRRNHMRFMTESNTFPPPSYRGISTSNTVHPQLEKRTTNLSNRPSVFLLLHTSSHIPHQESTLPL